MFAALHRRGGFVVVATEKGFICLLEVASLKVLDALQVWFPRISSDGTHSAVTGTCATTGCSVCAACAADKYTLSMHKASWGSHGTLPWS